MDYSGRSQRNLRQCLKNQRPLLHWLNVMVMRPPSWEHWTTMVCGYVAGLQGERKLLPVYSLWKTMQISQKPIKTILWMDEIKVELSWLTENGYIWLKPNTGFLHKNLILSVKCDGSIIVWARFTVSGSGWLAIINRLFWMIPENSTVKCQATLFMNISLRESSTCNMMSQETSHANKGWLKGKEGNVLE